MTVKLRRKMRYYTPAGDVGHDEEWEVEGHPDEAHEMFERLGFTPKRVQHSDERSTSSSALPELEAAPPKLERFPDVVASKGIPKIELDSDKLPSHVGTVNWILSRPGYIHSLRQLSQEFLGRRLQATGEDAKLFNRVSTRLDAARRLIERKYGGSWVRSHESVDGHRSWVYTFRPKQQLDIH